MADSPLVQAHIARQVVGKSLAGVNPKLVAGLQALAAAGHSVDVTSGYRSYAEQAALYDRYARSGFDIRYIAAKPGQSNHERGTAADVYVDGQPVGRVPAALRLLGQYGIHADVPGDWEHLDLTGAKGYTPQSAPAGYVGSGYVSGGGSQGTGATQTASPLAARLAGLIARTNSTLGLPSSGGLASLLAQRLGG